MNWIQRFLAAITTHKADPNAHHIPTAPGWTPTGDGGTKVAAADIEAAAGIPLTKLEDAVCSKTEADNKIAADTEVTEGAFDGTNVKNSNDTRKETSSTSYVKKKEVKLNENLDKICRIKFAIQSGVTGKTVYGRIYKNGIALGAEQSWNINEYSIKSEDFAANEFQTNDLVQIYVKMSADAEAIDVKDMRFYYDTLDTITKIGTHELVSPLHIEKPSISMTNQDP
ncbi:hypothetical protein ES703_19435 [subsurface metagenome]